MTAPVAVRYANTGIIAEFLIREHVIDGLAELRNSPQQLAELTTRFDVMPQGSQTEWAQQCRDLLLHMLDPEGGELVQVNLGHPAADAVLPWVGITQSGEAEDVGSARMADVLNTAYEKHGVVDEPDTFRITKHQTIGVDFTASVEVAVWALAPEASVVLHEAVQYVLFRRKGLLQGAGIRDITMSTTGFMPDEHFAPRVGYVPTVRLSCVVQRRAVRTTDNIPWQITCTRSFGAA